MTNYGSKDIALLNDEAWVAGVVERLGKVISGDESILESRVDGVDLETLR
jgi:hypothetical protein